MIPGGVFFCRLNIGSSDLCALGCPSRSRRFLLSSARFSEPRFLASLCCFLIDGGSLSSCISWFGVVNNCIFTPGFCD